MDSIEKRLLNEFQREFPLLPRPFQKIAEQLGSSEDHVIDLLQQLNDEGKVSRVGPVFAPRSIGASTLAAMAVPENRVEDVAAIINRYNEVNHNYEREHDFNLWFVVTASDPTRLENVLTDIEMRTGFNILVLPLVTEYRIDLGFDMESL